MSALNPNHNINNWDDWNAQEEKIQLNKSGSFLAA